MVGAGSWGTALAIVLAPRFERIRLWAYEPQVAEAMQQTRENPAYLPGFPLPGSISAGTSLPWAVEDAEVILGVMPSHHARSIYAELKPHAPPAVIYVSATKGLENSTLMRMSQLMEQVLETDRICVLSGPTFAREVARGEPAAIVVSSRELALARALQAAFNGPTFRLYTNSDPVGVEIGAALKNVIAIAAGVCAGLGLGANTMAALITRGLAEITRLAVAAGGDARTLAGLAGLGDLVLTCNGELSRNRTVGYELGRGRKLDDILQSMTMVAEGVRTTDSAIELAARLGVEIPITAQMHAVLRQGRSPALALRELMERPMRDE